MQHDGLVELTPTQTQFLFTIAQPYIQTGSWPTWDYVQQIHDRRGEDADELLAGLPYVGAPWPGGARYGFTTRAGRLTPDETIGLTIAAGVPLPEFDAVVGEPFLRVLHHMIGLQSSLRPEPGKVSQARLDSQELAASVPGLRPGFVANLPSLLDTEPATRSIGSAGAGASGDTWWRGITRSVLGFRAAKDLKTYVSLTCDLVHKWDQEQRVVILGSVPSLQAAARTPEPEPAAPEPTQYISQRLIDELEEAGAKSPWKVDKLLDLIRELNNNHAAEQPYSCLALIRAIMDHVPSVFGQKAFAGIVSSVSMTRTDTKHLEALGRYRFPGDDVMHRQASNTASHIDMSDVPPASYIKVLLREVLKALQNGATS
ncbi:hypothetical protein AB0N06_34805 [Streptomyces sp. NPDC051020]|uniref:hypothetical protein n=1 Tax=Streptomyces sp. NPDC051020 TaxID=3155409 RepID=UPI0034323F30